MKNLPSMLFGVFLGIAFVLACGEDSPTPADATPDATTCECPAAEKPIAGRIVVIKNDVTIPAMDNAGESAPCLLAGSGSILLSGSCDVPSNSTTVTLTRAGFGETSPNDWTCEWTNSGVAPVAAQVLAKCLVP